MKPGSMGRSRARTSPAGKSVRGTGLSRKMRSKRAPDGFRRNEDGAVAIITGLTIPVLLGFAGLAVEYGQILGVRAEAQRTADFASHAAAVAYGRSGDEQEMIEAARAIARLNGFSEDEIDVRLDASVSAPSGAAVRATITTPKPLYLPRLVGGDTSVDVVTSAVAGAQGGDPACIQAIDPDGSGITMKGGTALQAVECGVASNAEVEAPCGTEIITPSLTYNAGDHPLPQWCDTITGPDGEGAQITREATTDPLAGSAGIALAQEETASTAGLDAPGDIVVPTGPPVEFGWDKSETKNQAQALGCTASFSSAEWTFSCPGQTVSLGSITIGGGLSLRFNPGASPATVYNFSGSIKNTGTKMTFPDGTYNVAGGIITGGGSVTEFGAGTYRIGRASQNCGGARYSICNTSELSFDGPSEFILPGGIRNTGGSDLTLGTGNANSFRLGPSSGGDAISIGGGSRTVMGDADDGGLFEVAGRIDGGGGRVVYLR